jgi:hypothetical protein
LTVRRIGKHQIHKYIQQRLGPFGLPVERIQKSLIRRVICGGFAFRVMSWRIEGVIDRGHMGPRTTGQDIDHHPATIARSFHAVQLVKTVLIHWQNHATMLKCRGRQGHSSGLSLGQLAEKQSESHHAHGRETLTTGGVAVTPARRSAVDVPDTIKQPSLSKLESQDDMRISTLKRIVEALGGEVHIIAEFPKGKMRIKQFDGRRVNSYKSGATGRLQFV